MRRSIRIGSIASLFGIAMLVLVNFTSAALSGTPLPVTGKAAQVATAIAPVNLMAQGNEVAAEIPITLTTPPPAPSGDQAGVASIEDVCTVHLMLRIYKDRGVKLEVTGKENCVDADEVTGEIWAFKSATQEEFARTAISFRPAVVNNGHKAFDRKLTRLTTGDLVYVKLALNGQELLDTNAKATELYPVFAELRPGPGPDVCLMLNGEIDPHGYVLAAGMDEDQELHKHLNTDNWTWEIRNGELPDVPVWEWIKFTAYDTQSKQGLRAEYEWRNVPNPCYTPPTPTQTATATATPSPTSTIVTPESGATADAECTYADLTLRNGQLTGSFTANGQTVATVDETAGNEPQNVRVPFTSTLTGTVSVSWELTFTPSTGQAATNLTNTKSLQCGGSTVTATPTRVPQRGSYDVMPVCANYQAAALLGVLNANIRVSDAVGTFDQPVNIDGRLEVPTTQAAASFNWPRALVGTTSFTVTGTFTQQSNGEVENLTPRTSTQECGGGSVTPTPGIEYNDPRGLINYDKTCFGRNVGVQIVHDIETVEALEVYDDQGHVWTVWDPQYWKPEMGFKPEIAVYVPHWITEAGLHTRMFVTYRPIKGGNTVLQKWIDTPDVPAVTAQDKADCQRNQLDCYAGAYAYFRTPDPVKDDVETIRHFMADSTATMSIFRGNYEAFLEGDQNAGSFKQMTLPYTGITSDGAWFAYSTNDTSFYNGIGMYKVVGGKLTNNTQPGWQSMQLLGGDYSRLECERDTGDDKVSRCIGRDPSTGEKIFREFLKNEDPGDSPDCEEQDGEAELTGQPAETPRSTPRDICVYLDEGGQEVTVPEDQLEQTLREQGLSAPSCSAGDAGMPLPGGSTCWHLILFEDQQRFGKNRNRKRAA